MNKQPVIPENRGGKNKRYDFSDFKVNEDRCFTETNTSKLLTSAKSYCRYHNIPCKFRCYSANDGSTHIVRIK